MVFPSLETTFRSERDCVYNSMIMENNFNFNNSCNSSIDCNPYRPNVGNIPLRTLKEFPFLLPIRVEDMIYANNKNKLMNNYDKSKSFMMTSFDKLSSSGYEDNMFPTGFRHRKLKKEVNYKVPFN